MKITAHFRPVIRGRNLTGLTGGGATNLDGMETIDLAVGTWVEFIAGGINYIYQLQAGTDAEASPAVIRPDDYAGGTNEKIWRHINFPMLAPDGTVAAPSYSFSGDPASGMFRGSGNVIFSVSGTDVLTLAETSGDSDVIFGAGTQLRITPGSDQPAGEATLVAGTVTVMNSRVTTACVVLLTRKTAGGTIGNLTYTVASGSFTINSSDAGDTSTIAYLILKVA